MRVMISSRIILLANMPAKTSFVRMLCCQDDEGFALIFVYVADPGLGGVRMDDKFVEVLVLQQHELHSVFSGKLMAQMRSRAL